MKPGRRFGYKTGVLEELLARFHKDGDAAAMEAIVGRTRGRLLAIVRRIGNPQDAEDSVQAAYHALLARSAAPVCVEAWLTTAAVRIAYRRKALARRDTQLADALARDGDPHAAAARREEGGLVREAVAKLPAKYRDVLVLRWLDGLTVDETARLLEIPAATVKTRTRRGLALLRTNVAPWAKRAVLAGPWLVADAMRSVAEWGVIMNVKATMTMAGVAIAAGAVGLGIGATTARTEAGPRAPERPNHRAERRVGETESGSTRPVNAGPGIPARPQVAPGDRPLAQEKKPRSTFETRYAEAGAALGVAPEVLEAFRNAKAAMDRYSAKRTPKNAVARSEALGEVKLHGAASCLAAIAHLRADRSPRAGYIIVLDATWQPGMERHLLELARDPTLLPIQRQYALRGLSLADTPEVRDFLVAELEGAKQERLVAGAAMALGWLKEPRAVPLLERRLYTKGRPLIQGSALNGLRVLRSEESRKVLREYVDRSPMDKHVMLAIGSLRGTDPEFAAKAAQRFLDSPEAKDYSKNDRAILQATAAR